MKEVSLDIWIQLLGMISIVASLIFVGLEMRQSQRIALAGQTQERTAMGVANFMGFLEAGINLDNVIRSEIETLSAEELGARRINAHNQWYIAENDFVQFQNGLMPAETYEAKKTNLTDQMGRCDLRPIYEFRKKYFSTEFIEMIESVGDPCN
jgi:hypothetical protein